MANWRMIITVCADTVLGKELAGYSAGRSRVARLRDLANGGIQAEHANSLNADDRRELLAALKLLRSLPVSAPAIDATSAARSNDEADDDSGVPAIPNVGSFAAGLLDQVLGAELPD